MCCVHLFQNYVFMSELMFGFSLLAIPTKAILLRICAMHKKHLPLTGRCAASSVEIELRVSLTHSLIPYADYLIKLKHIFFRSGVLAANAVVLLLIRVIEHIYVEIPHKAGRASVIQFSFSSLSHVVSSSLSPSSPVYPSVNIGENAYPS